MLCLLYLNFPIILPDLWSKGDYIPSMDTKTERCGDWQNCTASEGGCGTRVPVLTFSTKAHM